MSDEEALISSLEEIRDYKKSDKLRLFSDRGIHLLHVDDIFAIFKLSSIAHDFFSRFLSDSELSNAISYIRVKYSDEECLNFTTALPGLTESIKLLLEREHYREEDYLNSLLNHSPRNIMLFLTNRCNLQCTYCYEKYPSKKIARKKLTPSSLKKALLGYFKRSAGRKNITVTFFGGEPLLEYDLLKMGVEYSLELANEQNKDVYFCVTTNATVLDDEMVEFLVRHRFGVMASLDGPKEVHDKYRKFPDGSGSYDIVSENIKRLLKMQLKNKVKPLKLRATLTNENSRNFDEIKQFFKQEFPGARIMIGETIGLANYSTEIDVTEGDEELSEKWFDEFYQSCATNPLEKIDNDFFVSLLKMHESLNLPFQSHLPEICGICRNMLAVSADGHYYPCHRFVGMEGFKIGSISKGMDYPRIKRIYERLITCYRDHCLNCWARKYCGGDCPAYLANNDNTFGPPNEKRCDSIRKGYEKAIIVFYALQEKNPALIQRIINQNQ